MSRKTTAVSLTKLALRLMDRQPDIPAVEAPPYAILREAYPVGSHLPVVSHREAVFSGLPACGVKLIKPYAVHKLHGPDGMWMSDQPCELVQMHREFACRARGRVLIGGLGLGVVARMIATRGNVQKVDIVEISPEIIRLAGPYLPSRVKVIQTDLFAYVESLERNQYDTALLDIWQGDGEWVWQTEVVPLRRMIGRKILRVLCWHEAVMVGQVARGIFRAADISTETLCRPSICHYYAFRSAVVDLGLRPKVGRITAETDLATCSQIEEENRLDYDLQTLAVGFLRSVGTPWWERTFGRYWDEIEP